MERDHDDTGMSESRQDLQMVFFIEIELSIHSSDLHLLHMFTSVPGLLIICK